MCNRTIADVKLEAFRLADELIGDRNLEDFNSQDFKIISNKLVHFLNSEVANIFPDNDRSDSGENARIERNISFDIVRHINYKHINSTHEVTYDAEFFNFRIIRSN